MEKPLLDVLQGRKTKHVPVWLMRQAGRYLPEYRKLRGEAGNFLNLCLTPKWAAEITMQPVRRFGMDAAILFADILLIPMALGQKLSFAEGEGPVLEAVADKKALSQLKLDNNRLLPVFETLELVKAQIDDRTALIGFCGAPWTVACYMVDGTSRNDFARTSEWAKTKPEALAQLISILIEASVDYLSKQIESGAEVLQIFDSWAGLLAYSETDFRRWVIEPTREIVRDLKRKYPHVPVIGFPREAGKMYKAYAMETGVDCLSIDQHIELDYARTQLKPAKILQGNLDPQLLVKGGKPMQEALADILNKLGPAHIANLGHGVLPQTPPEHVKQMVDFVHGFKTA